MYISDPSVNVNEQTNVPTRVVPKIMEDFFYVNCDIFSVVDNS